MPPDLTIIDASVSIEEELPQEEMTVFPDPEQILLEQIKRVNA